MWTNGDLSAVLPRVPWENREVEMCCSCVVDININKSYIKWVVSSSWTVLHPRLSTKAHKTGIMGNDLGELFPFMIHSFPSREMNPISYSCHFLNIIIAMSRTHCHRGLLLEFTIPWIVPHLCGSPSQTVLEINLSDWRDPIEIVTNKTISIFISLVSGYICNIKNSSTVNSGDFVQCSIVKFYSTNVFPNSSMSRNKLQP